MAGSRGRPRKTATPASNGNRTRARSSRMTTNTDPDIPEVFHELLSEAATSAAAGQDEDSKPLKKRKTAKHSQRLGPEAPQVVVNPETRSTPRRDSSPHSQGESVDGGFTRNGVLQTVTDYSEESEESDFEWEDVGLDQAEESEDQNMDDERPIEDLSIVLGGDEAGQKARRLVRRKGITAIERKLRLDIHKMHILCLLYHVHLRNAWCNDSKTQGILRKLLNPRLISNLTPDPEMNQGQASASFIEGLQEVKKLWSLRFSITALGLHQPRWADDQESIQDFAQFDGLDPPMECPDFRNTAHTLRGSQDIGAQLLCALLRSIGVEARLVCSLQCLPLSSAAQPPTPKSSPSKMNRIVLDPYNSPSKSAAQSSSAPITTYTSSPKRIQRVSRFGQMVTGKKVYDAGKAPPLPTTKKTFHTAFPVYWVEAFDFAMQKWIAIDPLATSTVNRPDKLEPPMSYSQNTMSYVIAFEEDLTARDVTRRYAKALNAKTRKTRVEVSEGGAKWWKKALKIFRRSTTLDRDQVEAAALARKEAAEGIPRNVQDFKGHPIYVLERHLKHNEIIQPKNQVGKINVGTATTSNMEPIYRRRDVHTVRSADKWYRMGREVREGEQPLKHAKPRKGARRSLSPDNFGAEEAEEIGVGLYAMFQTELYVPPPIVRGRVPRNAFGNLDIYVPSMIPKGGVHIRQREAAKAARIVRVDYADAVTGFQFRGRHGTAVIQGVIVAAEYQEAIEAVLDGMVHEQEQARNALRSAEALRLWRRFALGLRIAQRVMGYEIDGDKIDLQEELDNEEVHLEEQQMAGGFFPGADLGGIEPSEFREEHSHSHYGNDSTTDGGFIAEARTASVIEGGSGFGSSLLEKVSVIPRSSQKLPRNNALSIVGPDAMAGGFIPDTSEEQGGGFIPDGATTLREGCSRLAPQTEGLMDDDLAGGFIVDDSPKYTAPAQLQTSDHVQMPGHTEKRDVVMQETLQAPPQTVTRNVSTIHEPSLSRVEPIAEAIPQQQEGHSIDSVQAIELTQSNVADSSDEDRDSLPSEDPEDEDADPDWLVYST